MKKLVKFTEEERANWIKFCHEVADELGIETGDLASLTDEQLDKEADWYWSLTWK